MDIECPYCNKGLDINHDDGLGLEENVYHQMECESCRKNFVFETIITFDYEAKQADCLNDSEHDYQLTRTAPKEFSKMECTMCGETRELTEDERLSNGIGTKESYFERMKK